MKFNSQHIEQYLLSKGCVIQSAFFENSTIKLGSEFLFDEYRVIYRIEQRELIICSLEISTEKKHTG
jgi:Type III secretion system regulator (LcrR)